MATIITYENSILDISLPNGLIMSFDTNKNKVVNVISFTETVKSYTKDKTGKETVTEFKMGDINKETEVTTRVLT